MPHIGVLAAEAAIGIPEAVPVGSGSDPWYGQGCVCRRCSSCISSSRSGRPLPARGGRRQVSPPPGPSVPSRCRPPSCVEQAHRSSSGLAWMGDRSRDERGLADRLGVCSCSDRASQFIGRRAARLAMFLWTMCASVRARSPISSTYMGDDFRQPGS